MFSTKYEIHLWTYYNITQSHFGNKGIPKLKTWLLVYHLFKYQSSSNITSSLIYRPKKQIARIYRKWHYGEFICMFYIPPRTPQQYYARGNTHFLLSPPHKAINSTGIDLQPLYLTLSLFWPWNDLDFDLQGQNHKPV